MITRRLILLRHGQTEYNVSNKMQGQLDTDLTDYGLIQANKVAELLAKYQPNKIISSDLKRAKYTAIKIANKVGIPLILDKRLRETAIGAWEGLTHTSVDTKYPGERERWINNPNWAPPGGETKIAVVKRVKSLLAELVVDEKNWLDNNNHVRPIVMVSHGGLIAAITAELVGLPLSLWKIFRGLDNASWVQLRNENPNDSWVLEVWNANARVAEDIV